MKYLSAQAASKKYGLNLEEVNRLCVFRKIEGKRMGNDWYLVEESLEQYLKNPDTAILTFDKKTTKPLAHLFSVLGLVVIMGFILTPKNIQALLIGERVVKDTISSRSQAAVLESFEGVTSRTIKLGEHTRDTYIIAKEFFQNFGPASKDNFKYFSQKIANNWATFMNGDGDASVAVSGFSEQTRAALKEEITNELRQELFGSFGGGQVAQPQVTPANRGLVVVPSTGNEVSDQEVKNNLQNVFSDQVKVSFDASGRAGVITPVFRRTAGSNYLFILAPIDQ